MLRRRAVSLASSRFVFSRTTTQTTRLQLGRVANRTLTTGTLRSSWSPLSRLALATGVTGVAGVGLWTLFNNSDFNKVYADEPKVPLTGIPGTKYERTFIAVKPDGVQRGMLGEIIRRFERRGYKLIGIKIIVPSKAFAAEHYKDKSKKSFFPSLLVYFSSGPVIGMVWEGKQAVVQGRKILGAAEGAEAPLGSARGDLCLDVGSVGEKSHDQKRNIIHGSDSHESAKVEISLWFKDEEVANYERENDKWLYGN